MPRICHFEICCDDLERATRFYSEVFGWRIKAWKGPIEYYIAFTKDGDEPGIDGGFMKRPSPDATTINSIYVLSVDDFVDRVVEHGGQIVKPKMTIPGVGYTAYCKDTEGNLFSIMQWDESAE